jgi:integrase
MDWTCHDLRRSFASYLRNPLLTPDFLVERMLAHNVGGAVERTYNRATWDDMERDAWVKWADWLDALTTPIR